MLTDAKIRSLKPASKPYKQYDQRGLFLKVSPTGAKLWRLRYQFAGKSKLISLGQYPVVGVAEARRKRDGYLEDIRDGVDPAARRKAQKRSAASSSERSLETVAREWHENLYQHEVVPKQAERTLRRLELYVFPKLGSMPIEEIEPVHILPVLREIEKTGKIDTAHRTRSALSAVFRYAIATGRAKRDQTADLRGMLRSARTRHHPAVTDPAELPGLLRAIDGYTGYPPTTAALKLSALLFVRPGELRSMEWAHVNLETAEWAYQPGKGGLPLIVPLPKQAVVILREMKMLSGRDLYVFPSARGRGRPMSENTVNGALHRLGYKDQMSAHGFRAMARTILEERLGVDSRFIEMQLGHAVRDANGRAYNRTTFLEQRRDMLQAWADYLDGQRAGCALKPNVSALQAA
jgi:integrase